MTNLNLTTATSAPRQRGALARVSTTKESTMMIRTFTDPTPNDEPYCEPYDDPAYLAFLDEEEAIANGDAIELTHCYLCEPDVNKRTTPKAGPLRGVLRRSTSRGADPTEVLHLSCGHSII